MQSSLLQTEEMVKICLVLEALVIHHLDIEFMTGLTYEKPSKTR